MQRRIFFLTIALSALLSAADVAGKWVAQVPGRDGQTREQVMNFAVSGDKLTGKMEGGPGGGVDIQDGKVSGDTITFNVTREMGGNSVTWKYTGKVSGDEIKFLREGGRAPQEFTAKRAK